MRIYEARLGKFENISVDGYAARFTYSNDFKTIYAIKVGNRMIDINDHMRYEILERDENNRFVGDVNSYSLNLEYVMGYKEVIPSLKMYISALKANTKAKPFQKTLKR